VARILGRKTLHHLITERGCRLYQVRIIVPGERESLAASAWLLVEGISAVRIEQPFLPASKRTRAGQQNSVKSPCASACSKNGLTLKFLFGQIPAA